MDRFQKDPVAYEGDFVLWIEAQVEALRDHRFEELDIDNLLEELESIVRHQCRELRSRLQVIIMHLLKCEYQAHLRGDSWHSTLNTQRSDIEILLEDSPSLAPLVLPFAEKEYRRAVRKAVRETRLPPKAFPPDLPYTREQLLDFDYLP